MRNIIAFQTLRLIIRGDDTLNFIRSPPLAYVHKIKTDHVCRVICVKLILLPSCCDHCCSDVCTCYPANRSTSQCFPFQCHKFRTFNMYCKFHDKFCKVTKSQKRARASSSSSPFIAPDTKGSVYNARVCQDVLPVSLQ